jgi:hypothetical protein
MRSKKSPDAGADDPIMKEIGPGINIYEKPITENIILRPYIFTERIVNQTRKINDEAMGEVQVPKYKVVLADAEDYQRIPKVGVKASQVFVDFEPSPTKTKKLQFIKECMNQRSKKFYTLKKLVELGNIAESELDVYKFPPYAQDFPYRTIYAYIRVRRADGSEYLDTHEYITGVTDQGAVVSIAVEPNKFLRPIISHEKRHIDGTPLRPGESMATTETAQVSIIRSQYMEVNGTTEYLTPFTKEAVTSALKFAHGEPGDFANGSGLTLHQENQPGGIGVFDVEEWMNMDFKELWKRNSRPVVAAGMGMSAGPGVQPYS